MTSNLHTGRVAGEPLFHISKRGAMPFWKSWLIRIAAVIAALLVCGVLTYSLTGLNPIKVYATMLSGAFGTKRRIWMLAQELVILLLVALAVTPAFKMRFWNLGAEGQVLIGGLATVACMRSLYGTVPTPVYYVIMIGSAVLSGAVWALIPALFKARWNANESLFTLMMNYIAMQLVDYFVLRWSGANSSGKLGLVETGVLPVIGGRTYLLNVLVVAAFTVIMYFYLRRSKHGYEIAVVGESENTAKYIGINVKKVVIRTMLFSGALCGVAGLLLVGGTHHTIAPDTAGGRGFTAIMVSWLGKFDPLYMVLTSFIICFLGKGAAEITTTFSLNASFSDIITGIIIFFIIGSEFFINYRISLVKHTKEVSK